MSVDKSINMAIIMGTCGRDPEIRKTPNGQDVGNVSIATDEGYFDKAQQWVDKTEWHRITAWGHACKKLERVKKGDVIMVEGKIHTDTWDDAKTGEKKYSTCIVANRVKHIYDQGRGKAAAANRNSGGPDFSAPVPVAGQGPGSAPAMGPAPDDDLPF